MQVLYMVMPEEKFRGQFVRGNKNYSAGMADAVEQVIPGRFDGTTLQGLAQS